MSISYQQHQGFFQLAECNANFLDREAATLFDELREGRLQAVLVHDVYPRKLLPDLVEGLETHQPSFLKTRFPDAFNGWFYGRNLNLCEPQLEQYFDDARQFERDLELFLPGALNPAVRIADILARMDGGRPFRAPPGPDLGQRYMFTSLRGHAEGGYIPAHCDNEFVLRPSYQHLTSVCDPHIMSFVLGFNDCDGGGATEIYNYIQPPLGKALMSDDQRSIKPDVDTLASVKIRVPSGSMLVFDSGRYLHRLEPVAGSTTRWTACSFMALNNDKSATYVWG
ncbi:hypothetical protein R50073_15300 [Maricurvus nonylphenolicus]|uniref:2OG-Fe(II)-dependent halogenase WelO5 family protein n=1 Tax=Maricurvus nonylphenolicus TaxID=1008307 RepID=UPI0036F34695